MKILIKVIYIIILFALLSCRDEERRISLDETFVLKMGETKTLDGDHLSVTFSLLVEDSRCPANANCIGAGQAIIQIEFQEGSEKGNAELVTGKILDGQKNKVSTGHYTIELLKVIPYPDKAEAPADEETYAIQLIISG